VTDFTPRDPDHQTAWKRLSATVRQARLDDAHRRLQAIQEVRGRPEGETERDAIARIVTWAHRSSYRRWQDAFDAHGFEGLLDWRIAHQSRMPAAVREAICTLRRADANYPVSDIVVFVAKHHEFQTSETTVKRVLKSAGLHRRPGPSATPPVSGARRLELAGMRLVEAAAVETGYVGALAQGIVEHIADLPRPAEVAPVDTSDRDDCGRFLPAYNERYRKPDGDQLGPGFASVSVKREGMDPDRLQVGQVSQEVIERKLYAVMASPLLGTGRWDGIRVPRGQLLDELCGVAYMPATLEKFTGELKYAGVANTLWEVHARLWLEQTPDWGDERRAAVLYVDGSTKPIWTTLFSQATKVSNVGRTMPGIEQIAFHSGYGVPLWMATHSGRAPLVKHVPRMLSEMERTWGSSAVGRIVVIDAEANSVPFLQELERAPTSRAWVTRLRADWLEGKRIFNRTNYQPYRDGDRVRVGLVDLNDPNVKAGQFRVRVVEVERRTTGKVTYLGASTRLDENEWNSKDLADLYFDRWPNQEANFRAVNQATGSKQVHGYGKRLVDNISVVTKLDQLDGQIRGAQERLEHQQQEQVERSRKLREQARIQARRIRRSETVDRKLKGRKLVGADVLLSTQKLVAERLELVGEVAQREKVLAKQRHQLQNVEKQIERTQHQLQTRTEHHDAIQDQRQIFAHDVELDSLFSLLKVGLTLLATYVLKKYLGDARMDPTTFLQRMATLPATLRTTPQLEIVTFEYNQRDPEVMGLLKAHCLAINDRGLRLRSGRTLRLAVEDAPPRSRPPPPNSRVGSGDRFRR
jgi:hypothetical protein